MLFAPYLPFFTPLFAPYFLILTLFNCSSQQEEQHTILDEKNRTVLNDVSDFDKTNDIVAKTDTIEDAPKYDFSRFLSGTNYGFNWD